MSIFQGLSAFPITPTDSSGKVNTDELAGLLQRLKQAKVNSVGLLGSTGGYAYLTRSERRAAIETASQTLAGSVPLVTSVGAMRTDDAQLLARDAQTAGADGLLMAPVSYTPLTQEEAYQHYVAVAGETDLPLCIYNNPSTTHFRFEPDLIGRLSEVSNIQAVKMPLPADGDYAAELQLLDSVTTDGFSIGYSGDWGCAAGMLAGGKAWYSVVGGLFPIETLALATAAAAGDKSRVDEIDKHFQPMWSLFQEFGSLRVIYMAANILALTQAVPHRPLLPLAESESKRVEEAIAALGKVQSS